MISVFARIGLRYAAAALVAHGYMSSDIGNTVSSDADVESAVEMAIGGGIAAFAEGWHYLARRFGWAL